MSMLILSCAMMTAEERIQANLDNLYEYTNEQLLEKYYRTEIEEKKLEKELEREESSRNRNIFMVSSLKGELKVQQEMRIRLSLELQKRNIEP